MLGRRRRGSESEVGGGGGNAPRFKGDWELDEVVLVRMRRGLSGTGRVMPYELRGWVVVGRHVSINSPLLFLLVDIASSIYPSSNAPLLLSLQT